MRKQREIISICLVLISLIILSGVYSFAQDKDKIDKYFKMTLQEMMEVEISTAGRTPEKVGDIPASVVLITREDIESYGYQTLAEILENIPGLFYINDSAEYGANFGVRGFWSGIPNNNLIILIDGVSQENPYQSDYPLTKIGIPVEAIERIEVIRGPMSVIYGNGAFYGVINIFTNDFSRDESNTSPKNAPMNNISGSYGTNKTKKFFIKASGSEGDFKYVLNASIYDTYGMNKPLGSMVEDPAILKLFNVPENQTTTGNLEDNEKFFGFSGFFNGFYLNLSYIENEKDFYFLVPTKDAHLKINNNTNISFGYRKKISQKFTIDGKFNYFQTRVWEEFNFDPPPGDDYFYGIQQIESNALEAELNAFIYPKNNLEIKSGLYYRAVLNTSSMYDLPSFSSPTLVNNYFYLEDNNDIETRAFFTQISYKPIAKLNLVAGIRLEQMPKYSLTAVLAGGTEYFSRISGTYDQEKIEVIPRLAAIFSLNDKNHFKLLYGKAINRPSFFQNSNNSLDLSIEDLRPEEIQTIEVNYIGSFSSRFTISTSIFRNELENLITRVVSFDDEGNYQTWSGNAGRMVTNGLEVTLNVEPFENFRLELSGTYQETDDKRLGYENIKTAYSPNFLGYIKAAYRTKKITVAITGNYVDDMETYWDETLQDENNPFGKRIGDRVDGYLLLGANLRIEDLFIKGLYLNIKCSNLLDEEIRFPTFTNNQWATRGTIGFGRTLMVSVGLKF